MKQFLLSGFILSIIFNCLWVLLIFNSEMKLMLKCFSSLFLVILCTFIFAYMFNVENKQWNNGYCINCGTPYQAISYSHGGTRYECPNCHYAMSK